MSQEEEKSLRTEVALLKQNVQDNIGRRLDFLERITYGFVGVMVLGVLATVGGVIIWALGIMGHKKD